MSVYQDRWYQSGAAKALYDSVVADSECHPIAAIPTAGGKTFVLSLFIDLILSEKPESNVLVLSHVQEILEQDYNSIRKFFEWDDDSNDYFECSNVGLWSSGLGSKEKKKITVAGIQSVWRKPERFED